MGKIKYLARCIIAMNPARMLASVKQIAKENNKFALFIFMDMVWCALRYGAGHTDYRLMGFAGMPHRRRATHVTRGINNEYIRRLNKRGDYHKFDNKAVFNSIFAEYVGRDWLNLNEATAEDFARFASGRRELIVKPLNSINGRGVERLTLTPETDIPALYARLKADGQPLAEECVCQHPDMARLYPHSVNTLRLVTVAGPDTVHVVYRGVRMGAGGRVVDNLNFGGMIAVVNENGMIFTDATDKNNDVFSAHPDTGVTLKGVRLPFFNEAQEAARRAARLVPGIRYVGWDIAITEKGPVFIEGNHNPGYDTYQPRAYQLENEIGLVPVFTKIFENVR
jgi:hypothetical protein